VQIAKYSTSGVIQWQRNLGGVGVSAAGYSIAADSSGNVYVCGLTNATGTLNYQIAKYNTSGAIQWQRRLGTTVNSLGETQGIAVDSSGNVYVCGYSDVGAGNKNFQIAKYNTSGTIQWQRGLGGASEDVGYSVAVDSSSNVYVCGYSTDAGASDDIQIAKYNTSGAIQWQRRLGGAGNQLGYAIATDSSGNVYIAGRSTPDASLNIQIAKYNTSGTIQWQRRLGSANSSRGWSIATDSSSNVYICGQSNDSGLTDFQIAKYNTSGTIQWQRILTNVAANDVGRSISVDSSGNIYVCGQTSVSGTTEFLFAKLPGDGSATGTYTVGATSISYSVSTLTDASTSFTDAASTLTDSATTLTDAATTLTDAASTLTSSVTTI
jgi:uncharacterized delta-60 repeat protein